MARENRSGIIVAIGAFKLVKAVILIAAGLGALKLIQGGPSEMADRILEAIPVAPGARFLERAVAKLGMMNEKQLAGIAFGTFAYAAVFLVEGVGLLMRKTWAEWLTVIVTASFIPLEVVHIARHTSAGGIAGLALNVAIVGYLLVRRLRARRR